MVQPKNRAGADPSAQAAAWDVPQSQPFSDPGMCPLEVQAGQLSVENKLLPCFQALWQPKDNPQHIHKRPIPNLTHHPTLSSAPSPLCQTVRLPRGKMSGGATVQASNTSIFRLIINNLLQNNKNKLFPMLCLCNKQTFTSCSRYISSQKIE